MQINITWVGRVRAYINLLVSYSGSPMEVGRRKKEKAVIAMVSAIKNVLTVLAVAIDPG